MNRIDEIKKYMYPRTSLEWKEDFQTLLTALEKCREGLELTAIPEEAMPHREPNCFIAECKQRKILNEVFGE